MKCSECGCYGWMTDRYGREMRICTYDLPDEKPCERDGEFWEADDDENYIPSASAGDYSPSNPWDAPGMSVSDFI